MAIVPDPYEQRPQQVFPQLTAEQIARIAPLGTRRTIRSGELLFDQGAENAPFYVVIRGALALVRPHCTGENPITVLVPGEFTGEMNLLTGRRSLVRTRAAEDGEVLELRPEALRTIVQTDSELSELLMRAFILRRVSLMAAGGSRSLRRQGRGDPGGHLPGRRGAQEPDPAAGGRLPRLQR
jgi:thioredoxin reductase (NADPH)